MSSLSRGLKLLELIAGEQDTGLTFPELLQMSGYPNSSCYRILKELIDLNFLRFDDATRRYCLTMKISQIAGPVMRDYNLTKIAHPFMERLFKESKQTCNLGILGKHSGIFVDVIYATDYGIKLLSAVGNAFPLHCTALGKVLLSHISKKERDALLKEPFDSYTESTITKRDVLEKELTQVLKNGYAMENAESTRGIECVAAPIFNHDNKNVAALSVAIPVFAVDATSEKERILKLVVHYAALISEALGHHPAN